MDLTKLHNLATALKEKTKANHTNNKSWYRVNNLADRTEIFVYDSIGEYGVTAQDFVSELKSLKTPNIDLHINSEGGEVFDGLAIYEQIRQHPAHITATVDGLAASAASFIVQAADHRVMAKNARIMVHDAAVGVVAQVGNAEDLRKFSSEVIEMADLLDSISNTIAEIYAERSGTTARQWRNVMKGEKWYTADEAVAAGLADEIAGEPAKNQTQNTTSVNVTNELNRENSENLQNLAVTASTEVSQEPEFDAEAFRLALTEVFR